MSRWQLQFHWSTNLASSLIGLSELSKSNHPTFLASDWSKLLLLDQSEHSDVFENPFEFPAQFFTTKIKVKFMAAKILSSANA